MNYTTGSPMNYEAVPDVAVNPTCSGLPPLGETMRKTYDVLNDCYAMANRLLDSICKSVEEKRLDPQMSCLQEASMANADLAISVMHKLELVISAIGL